MSEIYAEIEREWLGTFKKASHEAPSRKGGFSDVYAEQEIRNRSEALNGLQPWLGILEFGIEWLANLHVALDKSMWRSGGTAGRDRPNEARHRVAWTLIGSAVAFGLSLRTLCLSGFDTPARALLRTYVETLLLSLAALHDSDLAEAYKDAEDDAQARSFWHTKASPKNLHKLIMEIERNYGLNDAEIDEMKEFRREEFEMLSQATHLSYAAAGFTVMAPVLGDGDRFQHAIFGLATESSLRTIRYAATTTWYYSRFGYNLLLDPDSAKCLLVLDDEDYFHRVIVVGREVLSRITLAHWSD